MNEPKMICCVCGFQQAEGVFSSRIAPVSCAYCKSCSEKGAEPYDVLVTRVAHLMLLQPGYELSPRLEHVKQVTLEISGITEEKFLKDVEIRRTDLSGN
ncbi:hypothetical protein D0469_09060 [Peribacillus saganii]|uniref:Uncharacterized protein n=2 Tax=Peribacillus saganii TaxID=2303992 RepID=A0A372LP42_9BACI|nr:hypothetical protein D0469_09060 [Peribacillus saganii]